MSEIDVNSPEYRAMWHRVRRQLADERARFAVRQARFEDHEDVLDIATANILKAVLTKPEKKRKDPD